MNTPVKMEEPQKRHIKFIKICLIILIPFILLEFILYSNILSHNFNYFYDIGSGNERYLSPANRVSEIKNENNINYRELKEHPLTYFNVPIPSSDAVVDISIRFKDNFPEGYNFLLGARDKEEWHYLSKVIYNSTENKNNKGNWVISSASFDVERDKLFVNNKKLSVMINAPHLGKEQYKNLTIPIDWIKITVHQKGIA